MTDVDIKEIEEGCLNILAETHDPNPFVAAAATKFLEWFETISLQGTNYIKCLTLLKGTTQDRQLWAALGDWWYYKDIFRFMCINKQNAYDALISHPHILNFHMEGRTFLSRTIVLGYPDEIERLLKAGADPYIKSQTEVTRDSFEYWIQYRDHLIVKNPEASEKIRQLLIAADTKGLYIDKL